MTRHPFPPQARTQTQSLGAALLDVLVDIGTIIAAGWILYMIIDLLLPGRGR